MTFDVFLFLSLHSNSKHLDPTPLFIEKPFYFFYYFYWSQSNYPTLLNKSPTRPVAGTRHKSFSPSRSRGRTRNTSTGLRFTSHIEAEPGPSPLGHLQIGYWSSNRKMNHMLPALFRCYSRKPTAASLDGLWFGNHEKTSTWAEQGVNYPEMSKRPVVMQRSLIITYHNSWRNSWQLQMGRAWS